MTPYKKPILADFYLFYGIIFGTIIIGVSLYMGFINTSNPQASEIIYGGIFFGIFVIVFCAGISQIFNLIGKTAYYTEKLTQIINSKSDSDNTVLLIEKLEEQKEEQEKTNKLLEDFLKRLQ